MHKKPFTGIRHILTEEERSKGRNLRSNNKKLGQKLKYYKKEGLGCVNCKHLCYLYNPDEHNRCKKALIMEALYLNPKIKKDSIFEVFDDLQRTFLVMEKRLNRRQVNAIEIHSRTNLTTLSKKEKYDLTTHCRRMANKYGYVIYDDDGNILPKK